VRRAYWSARIHLESEYSKQPKHLSDYLDELLSPDELLEKSSERLAAYFDAQIEGGEVTQQ
jgi:Fic family protein